MEDSRERDWPHRRVLALFRLSPLTGLLLCACASLYSDLPGVYYRAQFSPPIQASVCQEAASAFVQQTRLRQESTNWNPDATCDVSLTAEKTPDSPRVNVSLIAYSENDSLLVSIDDVHFEAPRPSPSTKQLATTLKDILQRLYPSVIITPTTRRTGVLGP